MKLYYWPGACSLSPHIVSREAGIDLQLAQLDRAERKTADGTVLSSVNPKNQVPVLEMDDGQKLTEGPVIVQYLADLKPASGLVPPPGSVDATASRNGSTSSARSCTRPFRRCSARPRRTTSRQPCVTCSRSGSIGSTRSLPASRI